MKLSHRLAGGAIALVFALSIAAAPKAAQADDQGSKNAALALGALSAGLLLTQKNKVPGIVAGLGAAYEYSRYQGSVNKRHERERYYDRYGNDDYKNGRYDRNDRNDRYYSDYNNRYDSRYDNSYNNGYDRNDRDCDRSDRNSKRYDSRYDNRYDRNGDSYYRTDNRYYRNNRR